MRTTRTVTYEKEVTTYKCDFCDFKTESNSGCCGYRPIMECDFCNRDICGKHRHELAEDTSGDYYQKLLFCDGCSEIAHQAWDKAVETAGRYDDIFELARNYFKEMSGNT